MDIQQHIIHNRGANSCLFAIEWITKTMKLFTIDRGNKWEDFLNSSNLKDLCSCAG